MTGGDSSNTPTDLVKRCIDLRKIPLDEYNLSDLRVMIGQQIGLPYLIPIAFEKLQPDIFIDVDFYEGDLLAAVLNVDSSFWKDHPDFWKQVYELTKDKRDNLKEHKISIEKFDTAKL